MTDPVQVLRGRLNADGLALGLAQDDVEAALAQVEALVEAATALYERVEMDESVGVCLTSRVESLTIADALAPFKENP